jgi:hypothetical protein
MKCRRCGRKVQVEAAPPVMHVARCTECQTIQEVPGAAGGPRLPVPLPKLFVLEPSGPFTVRWGWRTARTVPQVISAIVGAVVVRMFFDRGEEPSLFAWVFYAFSAMAALRAVVQWVNSTRLTLGPDRLELTHGPIPWFGRSLPIAKLGQLYVRELVHGTTGDSSGRRSYDVYASANDGSPDWPLIRGFETVEQALWMEQELERRMGIVDEPVDGEWKRGVA